jgi:hypothetical protein
LLLCCRDLGILRINLARLKDAVAPSPQRCIQEIHQLLPRMAEAAYSTFVGKLQDYTSRLSQHPTTPEEFAEFLQLMQEVEQQQRPLDREYDQVGGDCGVCMKLFKGSPWGRVRVTGSGCLFEMRGRVTHGPTQNHKSGCAAHMCLLLDMQAGCAGY